jgi:hypothetical protein
MATNRTADETVEAAFLSISSFLNSLHFLIQSSVFICPILYKFQMLQYTPDTNVLDILTQLMAKHEPLEYDFWRAMSMIGRQEPIWIIIDGFDESTESCQILIARLVELLTWTPKYRVIVLGRSYALMGAIQTTKFSIEMSSGLTKHDIDAYITAGVLKDTLLSKSELDASFSDVLKRKAGGKFLWAKLMINHLGRSANINEALKRLEDLPRGLKMAYIFILSRLADKLGPRDLLFIKKILDVVTIARRLLTIEETRIAHALVSGAGSTYPERLDGRLELKIFVLCGGLIIVVDGYLNLVHFSFMELGTDSTHGRLATQ